MLAVDYERGMEMMNTKGFNEHEGFFQDVLEIARRHKIMNPEKMRTEYAKVHYFLIRVQAIDGFRFFFFLLGWKVVETG